MGLISQFLLGANLTKLATFFEEVITATGKEYFVDSEGGFTHLSENRQAQLRFQLPKRIAALQKHPRHVITRELLKNMLLARDMGRQRRALAYTNLYVYLATRDIALDIETFNASYAS